MSHPKKIAGGLLGLVAALALWGGLGPTNGFAPNALGPFQTEYQRTRRLDAAAEDVNRRSQITDDLVATLIDGRIGLAEVARQLLALHEDDPLFLERHPRVYPGRTLLESVARGAADRAFKQTADPRQRERVAKRLTEEFQTHFPGVEPLRFDPEPPADPPVPFHQRRPLPPPPKGVFRVE